MDSTSDENSPQLVNDPPPITKEQSTEPTELPYTDPPTQKRTQYEAYNAKKPHICEVDGCQKRFESFSGFRSHLRAHDKGLKCRYWRCDSSSRLFSKRDEHEISVHGRSSFSCVMCGYSTPKEVEMRDHIINDHRGIGLDMNKAMVGIINGVKLGDMETMRRVQAEPNRLICCVCGRSIAREGMRKHVVRNHVEVDVNMVMARVERAPRYTGVQRLRELYRKNALSGVNSKDPSLGG